MKSAVSEYGNKELVSTLGDHVGSWWSNGEMYMKGLVVIKRGEEISVRGIATVKVTYRPE